MRLADNPWGNNVKSGWISPWCALMAKHQYIWGLASRWDARWVLASQCNATSSTDASGMAKTPALQLRSAVPFPVANSPCRTTTPLGMGSLSRIWAVAPGVEGPAVLGVVAAVEGPPAAVQIFGHAWTGVNGTEQGSSKGCNKSGKVAA